MSKTIKEAWEDLGEAWAEFMLTDGWNAYIGAVIGLVPLMLLGIWNDVLIITPVAFLSALVGYWTKVGTTYLPIQQYFKGKE